MLNGNSQTIAIRIDPRESLSSVQDQTYPGVSVDFYSPQFANIYGQGSLQTP
jgi:hypothetical protein